MAIGGNVLAELAVKIGVDSSGLEKGLGDAEKKTSNWGASMKKTGAIMTGVGAGITAALGFAVKGAVDFETGMREVNTMMGLSQTEFDNFSKEVHKLTTTMGVNAVEATGALYQAISAGVPKENVLTFLEIATKAAIGGVTSTEVAVDGLTTILNAFKLPMSEAEKVADIMFTTVKGGKTTFEELSASMFNVAPIAATAGIEFEEVAAAIATMTKQGVPTKQATTQIRQAIVAMIKPTAEMTEALTALGYESGEALISDKGLAGALELLSEHAGGSMEKLGGMFGSVEGLGAVLALTGENAQTFATDIAAMDEATGASQAAFEEMDKSTKRQWEKLKISMQGIGDTIGFVLLPKLSEIIEKIKPIITAITEWIAEHPGLTKIIVIGTAALGGLMLVLGPLLMILPGLIAALPLLGAAFTLATGPVGIIIAAIAALIAIGILVWKNWDTIKEKAAEIWGGIKDFFAKIWEGIKNIFSEHWDKILAILFPAVGIPLLIARNWEAIVGFVKDIFNRVADAMRRPIESAVNWIIDRINWVIEQINRIPGVNFGAIGHVNFGSSNVSELAGGGIVRKPTLAMIGEAGPEAVIPLRGGMPGGNTFNFTGPFMGNEEEANQFAELVLAKIRQSQGFRTVGLSA